MRTQVLAIFLGHSTVSPNDHRYKWWTEDKSGQDEVLPTLKS